MKIDDFTFVQKSDRVFFKKKCVKICLSICILKSPFMFLKDFKKK